MKKTVLIFTIMLIIFGVTTAATAVDTSTKTAVKKLTDFSQALGAIVNNINNFPEYEQIRQMFFLAFAIYAGVMVAIKYGSSGVEMEEVLTVLFIIAITRILMQYYNGITIALWNASQGFAGILQAASIGSRDPLLIAGFIGDVVAGIKNDIGMFSSISIVVGGITVIACVTGLTIIAYLSSMWALYGYALAKMIGAMFIPFMMVKRFQFLFDGWVKFFLGFLVYNIIARANLILCMLALRIFFNIPSGANPANYTYTFSLNTINEVFGLLIFMLIGVLALISTGKFASSIVSGATGFGSSMQTVASSAAKAAVAIL